MWAQLQTAMATLTAASPGWVDGVKESSSDAAQWLWEVLMGDFYEGEHTTTQAVTGTVISMIPLIDQLCDARDLVSNCKKIHKEPDNNWHWFALVLSLIGLFPVLGSLVKGCVKILVAGARRQIFVRFKHSGDLYKVLEPGLEQGIRGLNNFFNTPAVKKTLKALNIISPFHWLSGRVSALSKQVSTQALSKAFDEVHTAVKSLLDVMVRWGGAAMQTKAGRLLQEIKGVRDQLNEKLAILVKPLQSWLDQVARRLHVEGDLAFRARVGTTNAAQLAQDAEKAAFDKAKPGWVDKNAKFQKNPFIKAINEEERAQIAKGYPKNIEWNITTFSGKAVPTDYPAGTTLYRVVDPTDKSFSNGGFWMTKLDFDKLKSKDQWRRECAVWQSWNGNGEFVTYTVPHGTTLKGWSGKAATQKHQVDITYTLEGGAQQILLDPSHLKMDGMGKRQPTNWGYDLDHQNGSGLVGVPVLKHNWKD